MNAEGSLWIYLLEKWKISHKSENRTELTLKAFAYLKETLKERQGQPSEQEEIFAKEDTHKEFILKTYKQLMQFNIKNTLKTRKNKMCQRSKWTFLWGMPADRHMKRHSASLATREKQIKSPVRQALIFIRLATSKHLKE